MILEGLGGIRSASVESQIVNTKFSRVRRGSQHASRKISNCECTCVKKHSDRAMSGMTCFELRFRRFFFAQGKARLFDHVTSTGPGSEYE